MEKIGTNYGGWIIPKEIDIDKNSILYLVGVGEDMSFDLEINNRYDSNIILIDPTKKAKYHLEEVKEFYKNKEYKFKGKVQPDYYDKIKELTPNMDNFTYIDKGIWDKKDKLKFYKQNNKEYVSQSLIEGMFTENYDIVEVDSIKNIMNELGHTKIDLLKLDIEGAENKVLEQMLNDSIYPRYLLIEFDLYLKRKDTNNSTYNINKRLLESGYRLLVNDNMNVTYKYDN